MSDWKSMPRTPRIETPQLYPLCANCGQPEAHMRRGDTCADCKPKPIEEPKPQPEEPKTQPSPHPRRVRPGEELGWRPDDEPK